MSETRFITPLLPQQELDQLPVIALPGVPTNEPASYTALQSFLLPYVDAIHVAWWGVLIVTMAWLFVRYLAMPCARKQFSPPLPRAEGQGWRARYMRLFSLAEMEQDVLVRWFGGAILLGFIASYRGWQTSSTTTIRSIPGHNYECWPFFQNCADWIFLDAFPFAYSQMNFFMALFAMIVGAAVALAVGRIVLAHMLMLVLFISKVYLMLISFKYNANYDYYHTLFCILFLFIPHRRFFASLSIVMFYTLSTVAKVHPGWSLGLYFTAMQPGMPIFPKSIVPLMTNLVIFMEMVMAWCLFSRRVWLQRSVFAFFCLFHVYSGTLVGFHYPTIVMPTLIICFGPLFRPFDHIPLRASALPGWAVMAVLWGLQSIQLIIPGDVKLTLEGNFYGLYMFEANHQCQFEVTNQVGTRLLRVSNTRARGRCDPWPVMDKAQGIFCDMPGVGGEKPKLQFKQIHSINGGPFYQTINEPDLCSLTYKPFSHNEWIRDAGSAPIIGRPPMNLYQ